MKSHYFYTSLLCISFCIIADTTAFGAEPPGKADTSAVKSESHLPVIGIGYGALSFIGDVGNSGFNQPFLYRGGLQVEVQLHSKSKFEVFFHVLAGKVYGEEKSVDKNVNFESNVLMEGVNLRYLFYSKKYAHPVVIPFVSLGIESILFNPYTDLKDANGSTYYYWNDGTIRNLPQTTNDAPQAKIIYRDYSYETNIHDANVNGVGNFSKIALSFPISVGVKFKVSGRVALYLTETYHLTTTRYIDGSIGNPSANSGSDKILYSSASFHYDLAAPRETSKHVHGHADQSLYNNVNYDALQNADADGDGVPDMIDEDNSTPPGAKVDALGRAIDSDGDGVPDYRDKEPNSPSGVLVDENGATVTDSMQEAKFIRDSLNMEVMSKKITERIRTKNEPPEGAAGAVKSGLPDEFKSVDTDHDGNISADEIAKAIELYTAGKSPFSKPQFYKLIDYFFSQ